LLQNLALIASQVAIIFLLVAVGFVCSKFRLLDENAARKLSNVLLFVVMPCVVVKAFQTEFTPELGAGLLISFACAAAAHLAAILLSMCFFRRTEDSSRRVLRFSMVYSNCGFMCIPILQAVVGDVGVFYGSAFIAVFNIMQWTHGAALMGGTNKWKIENGKLKMKGETAAPDPNNGFSLKKAFINPGVVTMVVAVPIFLLNIKIPDIPSAAISHLAAMNTPLAMLVIGCGIQRANLRAALRNGRIWLASFLRLAVVPLLLMGVFLLFDLPRDVMRSTMIQASAPVAAGAVMFALRFGRDDALASELVALSTLLSMVTMPVIIAAL